MAHKIKLCSSIQLPENNLPQAGHSCPGMLVFEISAPAPISSNDLLGHIPNPLEILTSSEGYASRWNVLQNEQIEQNPRIGQLLQMARIPGTTNHNPVIHSARDLKLRLSILTLRRWLFLFFLIYLLFSLFTHTRLRHFQSNLVVLHFWPYLPVFRICFFLSLQDFRVLCI